MNRSIANPADVATSTNAAALDLQRLAVMRHALPQPLPQFLGADTDPPLITSLGGDFVMFECHNRWHEPYMPPLDSHLLALALEPCGGCLSWLAGEGRQQRDLLPGDMLILPAGEPCFLRLPLPHRFLLLGLRPRQLYDSRGPRRTASVVALRAGSAAGDTVLHGIATALHALSRSAGPALRPVADLLAQALAARLLALHMAQPIITARGSLGQLRLDRALAYLDAHVAEPVNLAEAARVADCSVHHFAHLFKASMGISPMRYLRKVRMQHARELLETTQMGVCDIGACVGIPDAARFSQAFRAYWKTSPSALRRAV